MPFLWVVPLALYLLSFILCFHSERWYFKPVFWPMLIAAIAIMLGLVSAGVEARIWFQVAGYSIGSFICFMICHGETAMLKPNPRHLTLYYLMIAIGGAAGGIFVGIVAPRLFTGYNELHIGLWLCCALSLLALRAVHKPYTKMKFRSVARINAALETLVVVILAVVLHEHASQTPTGQIRACRNFYGVLRVIAHDTKQPDRAYYMLQHGRIKHGSQFMSGDLRYKPTSYYIGNSGVGIALHSFPSNSPVRVGVIGLGTGTMAAYGRPGDYYCFYDINPAVIRLATDVFTYIKDCRAKCEIVEGDARISMEQQSPRQFDLLAVDAFTSDAIPVHLLTREAIILYLTHLSDRGLIAVHISNRYLDLEPVVQAIADDLQLSTSIIKYTPTAEEKKDEGNNSTWILLARNRMQLAVEPIRSAGRRPWATTPSPGPVWTDDYNDLFTRLVTRAAPERD
ncbi:MAG: fused MFS/spermidine synthase [bacterium]